MTLPLDCLDLRSFEPLELAFFLDFDGTLVEIAEHPDHVRLSPQTRRSLEAIYEAVDGALAIITGRDIGDVDRFLAPLSLPVAGVHGLKRRRSDGTISERQVDKEAIRRLHEHLLPFVDRTNGLILERKSGSLAVHYRARPDLEEDTTAAFDEAIHGIGNIHLVRGKMVIEAKGASDNKGGAVLDFLSEPPFLGRKPFFAGDDVTDEDAFTVANAQKGITVKIGAGETAATHRAADTKAFLDWLSAMVHDLERTGQR